MKRIKRFVLCLFIPLFYAQGYAQGAGQKTHGQTDGQNDLAKTETTSPENPEKQGNDLAGTTDESLGNIATGSLEILPMLQGDDKLKIKDDLLENLRKENNLKKSLYFFEYENGSFHVKGFLKPDPLLAFLIAFGPELKDNKRGCFRIETWNFFIGYGGSYEYTIFSRDGIFDVRKFRKMQNSVTQDEFFHVEFLEKNEELCLQARGFDRIDPDKPDPEKIYPACAIKIFGPGTVRHLEFLQALFPLMKLVLPEEMFYRQSVQKSTSLITSLNVNQDFLTHCKSDFKVKEGLDFLNKNINLWKKLEEKIEKNDFCFSRSVQIASEFRSERCLGEDVQFTLNLSFDHYKIFEKSILEKSVDPFFFFDAKAIKMRIGTDFMLKRHALGDKRLCEEDLMSVPNHVPPLRTSLGMNFLLRVERKMCDSEGNGYDDCLDINFDQKNYPNVWVLLENLEKTIWKKAMKPSHFLLGIRSLRCHSDRTFGSIQEVSEFFLGKNLKKNIEEGEEEGMSSQEE